MSDSIPTGTVAEGFHHYLYNGGIFLYSIPLLTRVLRQMVSAIQNWITGTICLFQEEKAMF